MDDLLFYGKCSRIEMRARVGARSADAMSASVGRSRKFVNVRFSKCTTACNALGCRRRSPYLVLSTWYSALSASNASRSVVVCARRVAITRSTSYGEIAEHALVAATGVTARAPRRVSRRSLSPSSRQQTSTRHFDSRARNGSPSYTGIRHAAIGAPVLERRYSRWLTPTLLKPTEVNMNWNTSRISTYGVKAADRVQSLADDAKSTAADMRSRVSDAMGKSADWASKKTDDLDTTSREMVGSMSDALSARPLLAVGIAVLAGFLISKLFSRD